MDNRQPCSQRNEHETRNTSHAPWPRPPSTLAIPASLSSQLCTTHCPVATPSDSTVAATMPRPCCVRVTYFARKSSRTVDPPKQTLFLPQSTDTDDAFATWQCTWCGPRKDAEHREWRAKAGKCRVLKDSQQNNPKINHATTTTISEGGQSPNWCR